jgi:hypothetical protein
VEYRNVIGTVLLIKKEIIQKGIMFDKIHVARNTVLFHRPRTIWTDLVEDVDV